MKKNIIYVLMAGAMTLAMSTAALAGTWQENATGWYWEEGSGSYPISTWKWLDGNQDGVEECYYFDHQGYLLMNATAPDGSLVDHNGCWIVDGRVQSRRTTNNINNARGIYEAAVNKTRGLDSYASSIEIKSKGNSYVEDRRITTKVENKNSSRIQYIFDVEYFGKYERISGGIVFYKDGYIYENSEANGDYKIKYPDGGYMGEDYSKNNLLPGIWNAGMMSDIQGYQRIDGNIVLTVRLPEESIREVDSWLNEYLVRFKMTEFTGTMVINPAGYIVESSWQAELADGSSFSFKETLINPGQPVEVVLPSTDGYEDQSKYY